MTQLQDKNRMLRWKTHVKNKTIYRAFVLSIILSHFYY